MFCQKCGKEMGENDKFCPACGWSSEENGSEPKTIEPVSQQYMNYQPIKKKRHGCLISIAIVVVIFIVLSIILAIAFGSSDSNNSDSNTTSTQSEQQAETSIDIGTEGKIGDLQLIVNSSKTAETIPYGDGMLEYQPDSGIYAIVNVTIANNTNSAQSILLSDFELKNSKGATYSATIIPMADDNFISIDSINPNLTVTGNLAFEVPPEVDLSDYKLIYTGFTFKNSSEFKIK